MTSSGMSDIRTDLCVSNGDAHITVRLPDILCLNALNADIRDREAWQKAGISLPGYDPQVLKENGMKDPKWIHFGIGNIFRIFIGSLADQLAEEGKLDGGIICAESFDYEVVDQIYRPYDNLALNVILHADGTVERKVTGIFSESVKADCSLENEWNRLKEIFRSPSLQMASFTITEKGYALTNENNEYYPFIRKDIENGPAYVTSVPAILAAMLKERFEAGKLPMAFVSMDNCSHNGETLRNAVLKIAEEWHAQGKVSNDYMAYITDESLIAFPWTMIDKITPRPSEEIAADLEARGVEKMMPVITSKKTFIAPFANAEGPQYLVIEDTFPNGRPDLEDAGVYMTDRETVNKAERMKVTACLNPIHTALCTYDCMLGYDLFADGMSDPELSKMARLLGYVEGMDVVPDPVILSPKAFLDELFEERFPNRYLGDTSQRIAVDISQMTAIRFGETIKAYVKKYGDAKKLKAIPLAIAGWLRYMLAVDDEGKRLSWHRIPAVKRFTHTCRKTSGLVKRRKPEIFSIPSFPILSSSAWISMKLASVKQLKRCS